MIFLCAFFPRLYFVPIQSTLYFHGGCPHLAHPDPAVGMGWGSRGSFALLADAWGRARWGPPKVCCVVQQWTQLSPDDTMTPNMTSYTPSLPLWNVRAHLMNKANEEASFISLSRLECQCLWLWDFGTSFGVFLDIHEPFARKKVWSFLSNKLFCCCCCEWFSFEIYFWFSQRFSFNRLNCFDLQFSQTTLETRTASRAPVAGGTARVAAAPNVAASPSLADPGPSRPAPACRLRGRGGSKSDGKLSFWKLLRYCFLFLPRIFQILFHFV